MTTATAKATERAEAIADLRGMLSPGDTVYTVLRSVARSGMSRRIDFYVIRDNQPVWLTGRVAPALRLSYSADAWAGQDGARVDGGGMDMGFHCVYNLGSALWPDATRSPHGVRNGEPDSTGGYALKHRWI